MPDELYPVLDADLQSLNIVIINANPSIVKESYDISIQNCVPRPVPGYFRRPKAKKQRKPWSFPESVFRDYVPDSDVREGTKGSCC